MMHNFALKACSLALGYKFDNFKQNSILKVNVDVF